MELTPLKVRCKRRLPGEPKHLPRQLKKRKVGRMEQSLSQHAAAQKQKRGSPLLDKLPTELLERIFVESGNVNLTRASHILGARLSSKAVFMRMIQRAFAPTWDEWFGCISLEVGEYTDAFGDADRFSGSPQEQSEILGFRWAKVPLLLEAQQRWLENQPRKVRQERRFQHLADFYKVPRRIIRRHQHVGTNHVDSVHECYRVDFEAHIHRLTVLTPADTYREGQNRLCLLDMHPRVRIPDCLLTGPYGEDEVHLLFWLVRGGTRIAAQQSWELTRQGFDHILMDVASLDHVAILIHMFGMLDVFLTRWPKSVFEQAVARVAELAQDESHERIAIFQYIRAYFKRVTDVRANIQLMYEPKPESEYYYTESESEDEDVGDDEADQDIDDAATDISPPSQVASETTQSADAASVAPSYTSIFSPAASTAATSSARTSISEGSLADPSSSKTVWASGAMSSGWFNEPSAS